MPGPRGYNQTGKVPEDGVGKTLFEVPFGKLSHGVNLYLNYAKEHWTHEDENPPVGLILCAQKDDAVARYALEGLPNKVMAAEYRTALPDEKTLAAEIDRTREVLEKRQIPAAPARRTGTTRKKIRKKKQDAPTKKGKRS